MQLNGDFLFQFFGVTLQFRLSSTRGWHGVLIVQPRRRKQSFRCFDQQRSDYRRRFNGRRLQKIFLTLRKQIGFRAAYFNIVEIETKNGRRRLRPRLGFGNERPSGRATQSLTKIWCKRFRLSPTASRSNFLLDGGGRSDEYFVFGTAAGIHLQQTVQVYKLSVLLF